MFTLARWIIRLSALLAPGADRARLKEEWLAELEIGLTRGRGAALRFALGAPADAWNSRDVGLRRLTGDIGADFRDAARSLRSTPLQTATIVLCLALGSALTVLMFTIVNGLVAGELPGVRRRAELVTLHAAHSAGERRHSVPMRYDEFNGLPARTDVFAAVAGEVRSGGPVNAGNGTLNVGIALVSGNYFEMLGGTPAAGRLLQPQDDTTSASPAAVISYDFWQSQFGGRADVVGASIRTARASYLIAGVAPRQFAGLAGDGLGAAALRTAVWLPLAQSSVSDDRRITAIARLRPDVTSRGAESASQGLIPAMNASIGRAQVSSVRVEPLHLTQLTGALQVAGFTTMFMSIPLVVLMIACANVAGVQLSRSVARTHELAIRVSLGATRARITRFLLVETFLTAATGGILAYLVTPMLVAEAAPYLAFVPVVDTYVVLFSIALPLVVTFIAGLGPARRATGFDVLSGLRLGARIGRSASPLLRRAVLVTQTALSVGLLILTLALTRGLQQLPALVGPSIDDVVAAEVMLKPSAVPETAWAATAIGIEQELRAVPGVQDVAIGGWRWFSGSQAACWGNSEHATTGPWTMRSAKAVTANYFEIMRVAPLRGRLLTDNDRGVLVNQAFLDAEANLHLDVGSMIRVRGGDESVPSAAAPIVGIVADSYERYPRGKRSPLCFLPLRAASSQEWLTFYVRSSDPTFVTQQFRDVLHRVEPRLAVRAVGGIDALMDDGFRTEWSMSRILGVISACALLLAAVGLFGAMSHSTSLRLHEFGVRLALGAKPAVLMASAAREAGGIVVIGAGLGALLVLPVERWLQVRLLPTITMVDPIVFGTVTASLIAIALAAAWMPSRRISAIDPVSVLKAE